MIAIKPNLETFVAFFFIAMYTVLVLVIFQHLSNYFYLQLFINFFQQQACFNCTLFANIPLPTSQSMCNCRISVKTLLLLKKSGFPSKALYILPLY